MVVTVRRAVREDHHAFARLFPELGVDDPLPSEPRFAAELLPRMRVAEDPSGAVVGYALFDVLDGLAYVRHLVTAKGARRRGVGRRLLRSVADESATRGATSWVLNVAPKTRRTRSSRLR
jgi:ribosomal protein S18 acetylase RimI-like enzyme